jgi:hypothetical protein
MHVLQMFGCSGSFTAVKLQKCWRVAATLAAKTNPSDDHDALHLALHSSSPVENERPFVGPLWQGHKTCGRLIVFNSFLHCCRNPVPSSRSELGRWWWTLQLRVLNRRN